MSLRIGASEGSREQLSASVLLFVNSRVAAKLVAAQEGQAPRSQLVLSAERGELPRTAKLS
jgi:hypothetical protein